ncbi:uncharacterized protein JCM10292_001294 [Rhodotorula paludigena]|uniref:uncharacterized protein n=1 Tax=Rhodotorula paludigena TaxID=86838 RepID=UPI00317F8585
MQRSTRIIPGSRRFLATGPAPTGRPIATDKTTNLGRQTPAGYGGTGGPIPQAGGSPPPPKKSNVGFIVGALALVGGSAAYYMSLDDPKKEAAADLKHLGQGAKHELEAFRPGSARSDAALAGPTAGAGTREAERFVDKLRSPDDKYGAEQVKDSLSGQSYNGSGVSLNKPGRGVGDEVRRWGDALSSDEKGAWAGARDEVHRWGDALRSGPSEKKAWKPTLDEIKRYRDMLKSPDREYGYEQVERAFHGNGLDVTTVGSNPWFDCMGPGRAIRRGTVERKLRDLEAKGKTALEKAGDSIKGEYERAKSAASEFGSDVKSETQSWINWGSNKAEDAKARTEADLHRAKETAKSEASSWSSWTSAKADEAKSSLSSAASSVESSASSAYNQAANSAEHAKDKVEAEGKSWWNWSGEKAADAKDGLKAGLLNAEKGVERGAQKAQDETRKL